MISRLPEPSSSERIYTFPTVVFLIIAGTIGTGIFTSTGFVADQLSSPFLIIAVWLVAGFIALCGALTYAELGIRLPEDGGEYKYLSVWLHPLMGFLSGWTSLWAGFAAPVAAAALAFGSYLERLFPEIPSLLSAIVVILFFSLVHAFYKIKGALLQNAIALIKIAFLATFIGLGLLYGDGQFPQILPSGREIRDLFSAPFATALILVSFSYSGWNTANYIAGEIKQVSRNLVYGIVISVTMIVLLYLGLNLVYLYSVPVNDMKHVVEIAWLSAFNLFGDLGAVAVSLIICITLLSTISAMIFSGPRIYASMALDIRPIHTLIPQKYMLPVSVLLQSTISIGLLLTFWFDEILYFIGFTLNIFTTLTAAVLIKIRMQNKSSPIGRNISGYPVLPVLYILFSGWCLIHFIRTRPIESLAGLLLLISGVILYLATVRYKRKNQQDQTK